MKENKDIEKILLNEEAYDKFVSTKIEKEFLKEVTQVDEQNKVITDIKSAPKELLFTQKAIYKVMNKKSKTQSLINGIQAEAFLGAQNSYREKFLSAQTDFFVCGDNYIKFYKLKV